MAIDKKNKSTLYSIQCLAFKYSDEAAIRRIRNTVFTREQGVAIAVDFDGNDAVGMHSLVFIDGQAVGTGRLLKDGHIGRIAVLRNYRGQGIGAKIVLSLIDEARKNKISRVYLGAQIHALGFYSKLGFTPFGEKYTEAGIQHLSMEKVLK